jgi:predicted CoA-binding protein
MLQTESDNPLVTIEAAIMKGLDNVRFQIIPVFPECLQGGIFEKKSLPLRSKCEQSLIDL